MFVKLALFSCFVAAVLAVYNGPLAGGVPASLFPAGISPHACPNYPHCSNPSVAANPNAPAPAFAPAPAHYGQYNPGPVAYQGGYDQNALNSGVYTGDGDYHGEGLAESGAFGDVSQGYNSAPAYNPAPAPAQYAHQPAAALPAGVSAQSCPNYPYCH
ncbi:hypothetical protein RI129_002197 [Pyrocoelia pectoralis]|uniref:Cuticle protein CPCFC domain-containing protein n=1 Tax=Pyrocoelia pectoralis TaxID=417401 RepID=A0AAN7VEV1_9COLE